MLPKRLTLVALVAYLVGWPAASAKESAHYAVPRTEHGHPDFQGIWTTAFLTMLERPPGVPSLIATREQAEALVSAIRANAPKVVDPDFQLHDIRQLAMVKGQYRTSIIVEPEDGQLPFTEKGLKLAAEVKARDTNDFDAYERRPLAERCLENLGYAPMRAVPVLLPRQIVQTRDHVLISSEDSSGARLIHLGGLPPADVMRTIGGYSVGRWENDTLVVETTHLRADDPARSVNGRPLLLSRRSKITEWFTRVSATELFYRFTVEDDGLYTRPWSGEFSMTRHDGPIYEYACHEGNYSLTNILRNGRSEAARLAAESGLHRHQ
jgi:hypothetical protein